MRNFTFSTTQDGGWRVFVIHELGCVGQMKYRSEIRSEARSLAALWLDIQPGEINIGRVRYMVQGFALSLVEQVSRVV